MKILEEDVKKSVAHIEKLTGNTFGDAVNPLLVSVRSGARVSMPGMMDTVLNLGINDTVVEALSKKSGNPRFAWDSYRRFVQMYGDVVLGMKPKSKQDIDPFEEILDKVKEEKGVKNDTELTVDDLKGLVVKFKAAVKKSTGKDFPESAGAIVGRYLRSVRQLDERARNPVSPHEPDSGRVGYGSQRTGHGLRKYGQHVGYRCGIHPRRRYR